MVQTRKQQQMLLHNYGLESIILPMPCLGILDKENQRSRISQNGKFRVLWVGRIDREKRLELLLEVAEALPEVLFDIAGKPTNTKDRYSVNLLAEAKKLPNVKVHGMVPR